MGKIIGLFLCVLLCSCSSEQSLQEYFVANSENPNFISFDVPASILNLDKVELTAEQEDAMATLKKLNVLAFKKNEDNTEQFKVEQQKLKAVLENAEYTELMTLHSFFGKGSIQMKGDADAVDELIIFGSNKDKGFALVRVLGNDMNPANLQALLKAIEKSDNKEEAFEKFGLLFK